MVTPCCSHQLQLSLEGRPAAGGEAVQVQELQRPVPQQPPPAAVPPRREQGLREVPAALLLWPPHHPVSGGGALCCQGKGGLPSPLGEAGLPVHLRHVGPHGPRRAGEHTRQFSAPTATRRPGAAGAHRGWGRWVCRTQAPLGCTGRTALGRQVPSTLCAGREVSAVHVLPPFTVTETIWA